MKISNQHQAIVLIVLLLLLLCLGLISLEYIINQLSIFINNIQW